MGQLHRFLGLTVGDRSSPTISDYREKRARLPGRHHLRHEQRVRLRLPARQHGPASTTSAAQVPARPHYFAIVDEVDSILDRRGPHAAHHLRAGRRRGRALLPVRPHRARPAARPRLRGRRGQAHRRAHRGGHRPGRAGARRREPLRARATRTTCTSSRQALRAKELFKRDVDYVVQDGEVKIVDEFTGRILEGRRWSEGLHQAVEAKEGVQIKEENQTLATITLQNYFRMYDKLAGMTGTAVTEAGEFAHTYDLRSCRSPRTGRWSASTTPTSSTRPRTAKFEAVADDIAERHEKGQPVLVGTISVEKSEQLSRLLEKRGIPHEVLNAKQHEREAEIVTQAGQLGVGHGRHQHGRPRRRHPARRQPRGPRPPGAASPTGTSRHDGSTGALRRAASSAHRTSARPRATRSATHGGLYVLGTERHESRRIDNQLRGRSGRQGDPGREPLLPVPRGRAHAAVRDRRHELGDGQRRSPTTCRSRRRWSRRPSSGPSARSRTATSRSARTCSSTTR